MVKRNRSKAVELLARVYDHVEHKYQKDFTMFTLGWSDGYRFVPVGFNLLSSAKKSNRYQEISDKIDHRINGYRTWKESLLAKVLDAGLDMIGMVKQLNQRYSYQGRLYPLPQLRKFVRFDNSKNIFGLVIVTTKNGIPVKIVLVRNRNKKSECLYLLSTHCSLSDAEIVRIYENRWSIECFFKTSNHF